MPIFDLASEHLKYILVEQLNFNKLFNRVISMYSDISYENTLKILVRARICFQMYEDATYLLCKYLDFVQE